VGSFGDLSVFSFYPTKILGGYGDAGMVLTNSKDYNDSLRRLRFYGMESQYYSVQSEGYNSRMDEIHAAILRYKLTQLDSYVLQRRNIAKIYSENLDLKKFKILAENESCYHSFYLFVIKSKKRDKLLQYLKDNEIYVNISYPWPIHTMSGFKDKFIARVPLLNTENAAKKIISLPMYPSLSLESVNKVIKIVNEFS
jgi:aminotransferase EvaB